MPEITADIVFDSLIKEAYRGVNGLRKFNLFFPAAIHIGKNFGVSSVAIDAVLLDFRRRAERGLLPVIDLPSPCEIIAVMDLGATDRGKEDLLAGFIALGYYAPANMVRGSLKRKLSSDEVWKLVHSYTNGASLSDSEEETLISMARQNLSRREVDRIKEHISERRERFTHSLV